MNKQLLKSRVESVVYTLDNVDYYQFVFEDDYVILEVVLNKFCLFDSHFRKVVMISEFVQAYDWHIELLPREGNSYNSFKLCFMISLDKYE